MHAIVDTGFLVAFLNKDEPRHPECLDIFRGFSGKLLTTEAVLTETLHFVRRDPDLVEICLGLVERGMPVLVPATHESLARCRQLMRQYHDLPMDFADATLVCLAELTHIREIWTLDSDFNVYRAHGRGSFKVRPQ